MVREQRVDSFYFKLRESALSCSSSPLLIFPSTSDVDSLCALKIIFHILESDSIQYACYPVSSFNEIHKYITNDDPISIVLINWGCHRDLRNTLNLCPNSRVFVIDSHRPIHLHNLSDQNDTVVVLFTKDDEQQSDLAYDFDLTALANAATEINSDDELGSEEEEEDSESENEEGDKHVARKRRRVSEEDRHVARKRRRVSEEDPVRLYKKLKKEYYRLGTFHGKPSGCLMYDLAHFLRKNTNELLWLACVALTDQFVHQRLSDERYH